MRSENPSPKSRSALLDAPEESLAARPSRVRPPEPTHRREFSDHFADGLPNPTEVDDFDYRRQRAGYKLKFRGRVLEVPKTLWGRIAGACAVLILAGCFVAGLMGLRSFFLHDGRFTVASSSSIQIVGNTHLSRAQLLSVFGEDVERNIFNIPLAVRRAELESLPWVAHATVMRLLPNHLRIAVVERTPVAFVRQGSQIGMVDASGVLLDMPPDAPGDPLYSFPVVTGIAAADPLSTRAARMKIYAAFTGDLDSAGSHISEKLSEVDLSNPEDVKALIPQGPNDVLVHFGDTDFLTRYQKFEAHLAEWRTQYPKLASVDMRYDPQIVLEMLPGTPTTPPGTATTSASAKSTAPATKAAVKALAKPASKSPAHVLKTPALKPAAKPVASASASTTTPAATSEEWHMVVVKPHTKAKATPARPAKPVHPSQAAPQ